MPKRQNSERELISVLFEAAIDSLDVNQLAETPVQQIIQSESILSPSPYSLVSVMATAHTDPSRNWDLLKGATLTVTSKNPNIGGGQIFTTNQTIYRLENRVAHVTNSYLEQFDFLGTDVSVLFNAERRISNYFQCQSPSQVAAYALQCLGVTNMEIEPSGPSRDYQAANIHPFQVLAEQADVALAGGTDPSFLHFATLEGGTSTHHFKSVRAMTKESPVWRFRTADSGGRELLSNPGNILHFSFPCDFDLLGDLMNGMTLNGGYSASTIAMNPFTGTASLIGGGMQECGGIGGALVNSVQTDTGSTDTCGTTPEDYTSLRQARLSLIQPDKIALAITVPYNPLIHVGDMIECIFVNRITLKDNYGSGEYLIVNLTHTLKAGGYGVTSLDLVSNSVGVGVV